MTFSIRIRTSEDVRASKKGQGLFSFTVSQHSDRSHATGVSVKVFFQLLQNPKWSLNIFELGVEKFGPLKTVLNPIWSKDNKNKHLIAAAPCDYLCCYGWWVVVVDGTEGQP